MKFWLVSGVKNLCKCGHIHGILFFGTLNCRYLVCKYYKEPLVNKAAPDLHFILFICGCRGDWV